MTNRRTKRKRPRRRRRTQKGGEGTPVGDAEGAPMEDAGGDGGADIPDAEGPLKGGGKNKKKKKKGGKRPLNAYFKLMLAAKARGDPSFVYNGTTYHGRKNGRLGMIYSKSKSKSASKPKKRRKTKRAKGTKKRKSKRKRKCRNTKGKFKRC